MNVKHVLEQCKKELETQLSPYYKILAELKDINKALEAFETCKGCSGCDECRLGPYYR